MHNLPKSSKIIIIGKFNYCFADVKNKSKIDFSNHELHPKKEKKSTKKLFLEFQINVSFRRPSPSSSSHNYEFVIMYAKFMMNMQ